MLAVQLIRKSDQGIGFPVGETANPAIVRAVTRAIVAELGRMRFTDPVLDDMAQVHRETLRRHLQAEGQEDEG